MLDLKGTLDSLKAFLLRKLHGEDFQVKTEDGYSVYLFWHAPSTNMGWYPILQIYKSGRSVYFQEGAENSDLWYDLAIDAGTYLCPC
jgi:hypothetical protein